MNPHDTDDNEISRQEIESQMQGLTLQDILADLASRFLINIPAEELKHPERMYWGVEEAHWFYEDFIRPVRRDLPSFTLQKFGERIIAACSPHGVFSYDPVTAYKEFIKYKTSVPVRGAILLNPARDKVLLVKGWKSGASWGFPRGKINEDEADRDCAVRECWEEIGYDISPHFDPSVYPHPQDALDAPPGLFNVRQLDARQDFIDVTFAEQQIRLFIVFNVPEHTVFETRTRKEISDIRWHPLRKLPGWQKGNNGAKGKFYGVAAVLRQLRIKLSPGPNDYQTDTSAKDSILAGTEDEEEEEATSEDLEESTRALQKFFLTDPGDAAGRVIPPSEAATVMTFPDSSSSAGISESIANDAEEHNRQRRRKALLKSLDDMLATESRQSSAANSPSGSSSHQSSRRRHTATEHAMPAPVPSALDGPGLLATLFATADKSTREQHQQRRHSGGSVPVSLSPPQSQSHSSPKAPYPYPSPSKLYSPQPQHQSPLALFEPTQASNADDMHYHPSSLAYQPSQHHFFTPGMPSPPQPPFPSFSQAAPQPPPPMPQLPAAPALQPVALRPIPLLTNFQSPSPVMPQAAQHAHLPPIDPQQQASLLNLLNGGNGNTTSGPSAHNLGNLQSWNQPNYPSGSPAGPGSHNGQTRSMFT